MTDLESAEDVEPLDEVRDVLSLTVEVLEDAIEDLKAATQAAVHDEKFDLVTTNNERMRELRDFTSDASQLLKRWDTLRSTHQSEGGSAVDAEGGHLDDAERQKRQNLGRAERGTRTPEAAFRRPLLEVLRDAGGSLSVAEAIDQVGELMKTRLTPVDLETLPSDHRQIRWRNTTQWARQALVDDGQMDGSVRGVWTITDAGRTWLERRQ